ncbi:universal stress protein [Rhodococcus triatomae]|uniref:Nucleotide-binding universal stress protein, UspA family n=1 Tax=Rhodococcus triatomae TaxID=300028 RepID=A0A1G8AJ22_9NOCA|nr:universal stress protein [Rhodococcus triatomae]QNG17751.1 universal stress protein [Rhodococcus triatomae]QNG22581.1 universal stress protein [Rhodococcus triatomae]SDH21002.1 Nucleotide-binding universal stress protein, UspA family [Rhodococcus triatomae]
MSTPERNAVVVGADGSETAKSAVTFAAEMASRRGATLEIVHALDFAPYGFGGPYMDAGGVYEWVEEGGRAILADVEKLAKQVAPDLEIRTELAIGSSSQWLVDLSEKVRYVVVGASGAGAAATALLLGNTAVSVTTHAKCPVVVVRGETRDSGPVVVGVDGSATSKAAIRTAFEEASFRGAPLVAVHVWSDLGPGILEDPRAAALLPKSIEEEEHAVLAESLAGWQEEFPDVTVERKVYVDNPRARLVEWSKQAQLLVVGSRGRGGFRGMLLGSTSNNLIGKSECPVMVVRPTDD